ncbi:TetR/AcrR family transcriptional regulator, partial [Burkholderia sp. SIMBA_019]
AFARALPDVPRQELGWRLHFALKALAGVLAGDELGNLMPAFTQGKSMSDAHVLAQLTSMVVAALKAPAPETQELGALQDVFDI